ncbi:hypothetical protein AFK24_06110 [Pseudomonas syringae]|uniref:Fumarylacetoacetase-like C-terminal domain-containing protein n=1 Tax=Pseudomonas syringae TaxID=317 RepID=A0A1C7ZA92_PSESX|nr:hypothetical protein AFK24_06110 [Pseudomonas syringae]
MKGHRFQNGNTSNLICDVRQIVSYVSQFYQLEPGDVITIGIEGLGNKRQEIVAWKDCTADYTPKGCYSLIPIP